MPRPVRARNTHTRTHLGVRGFVVSRGLICTNTLQRPALNLYKTLHKIRNFVPTHTLRTHNPGCHRTHRTNERQRRRSRAARQNASMITHRLVTCTRAPRGSRMSARSARARTTVRMATKAQSVCDMIAGGTAARAGGWGWVGGVHAREGGASPKRATRGLICRQFCTK